MTRRALLLLPGAYSAVGGIEAYSRLLVKAFSELIPEGGLEPRVLLLNDNDADLRDGRVPEGLAVQAFGGRKAPFAAAAMAHALADQPALILFGHLHFAVLAPLLKAASPRAAHWYVAYGIEAWRAPSRRVRAGLAFANRLLCISDYTRSRFVAEGGPPIPDMPLLPCALDPVWMQRFEPAAQRAGPGDGVGSTVLTVARLAASEGYKGIDTVIRSLPAVSREIPDVRYEVVGDGDDRSRLEGLARETGVVDRVRFLGRLSSEALANAYRRCAVFAMPSDQEGFGIVYLEAALFSKPSVAGTGGGAPEVVVDGETGLLAGNDDAPAVARALVRLLGRQEEARRMGQAARCRLDKKFDFNAFRSCLAGLLRDACRKER